LKVDPESHGERGPMASLSDLPSFNPSNFSQFKTQERQDKKKLRIPMYTATHAAALPPADQFISTEATNILLRHFYDLAEQKRQKRTQASSGIAEQSELLSGKRARPSHLAEREDWESQQ